MANTESLEVMLRQAEEIAATTSDEEELALVGHTPAHLHGDEPLSPEAARDALAAILRIPVRELRELSAESAVTAVTRLTNLVSRLTTRSLLDDLTGAIRRGAGLNAASREISRARRAGTQLVVAMVDVDGLKQVNDSLGHPAGDALLRQTVSALRTQLRDYDLVIRYGGDEFLCVLPGADLADAELRFREVAFGLRASSHGHSITAGLASLQDGDSLDSVVARADEALYAQRRANRHSA